MNNNDSNSLILGRIGGHSQIGKTYLESMFITVDINDLNSIFECQRLKKKIYFNGRRVIWDYDEVNPDMKEVEIINISSFVKYENYYKSVYTYFIIEFIEKNILLRHLMDERMILEDNRRKKEEREEKLTL